MNYRAAVRIPRMKRVVILISGRGSNCEALLTRIEHEAWPISVAAVIASRPDAPGIDVARRFQLPVQVIDHRTFAGRPEFDRALATAIDSIGPDLLVLAGFMRILTAAFCARYQDRLLNIHPSLLPAFPGLRTHQQAIDAGVTVHGCTVHAVTPDLDHGPILAQAIVPVLAQDNAESLGARVLEMEHRLYPMCVAAVLSGRVQLVEGAWVARPPGEASIARAQHHFMPDFAPCLVHPFLLQSSNALNH